MKIKGQTFAGDLETERRFRKWAVATQKGLNPAYVPSGYPHNPKHVCGTCSACGEEMVWNVPRLGPVGGFIHKATNSFSCRP